jgi:hypothetical protein
MGDKPNVYVNYVANDKGKIVHAMHNTEVSPARLVLALNMYDTLLQAVRLAKPLLDATPCPSEAHFDQYTNVKDKLQTALERNDQLQFYFGYRV